LGAYWLLRFLEPFMIFLASICMATDCYFTLVVGRVGNEGVASAC